MPLRLDRRSRFKTPFDPFTAVLFKFLQGITYLFVLALLFISPVNKKGIIDPKAEYIITVTWPDMSPDDIDTWIEDPAGSLIWFRNPQAGLVHIDRDDRGMLNDTLTINGQTIENPLNQEVTTIRGVVPGEYIVNIHYYASQTNKPVPVTVRLDKVNPQLQVIFYETMTLSQQGEEKTAFRFTIGVDGSITEINRLEKSLVKDQKS